jgi:hypothetical protein
MSVGHVNSVDPSGGVAPAALEKAAAELKGLMAVRR